MDAARKSGDSKATAPALPADLVAAARYDLALAYRAIGRSAQADAILSDLAKAPAGPITADAQFLVGQSHVDAGRYAEAVGPLEGYLSANPRGDVAEFAMAHLVMAQLGLGKTDAAWKVLDRLAPRVSGEQESAAGAAAGGGGSPQCASGRARRSSSDSWPEQGNRGRPELPLPAPSLSKRRRGPFKYEPTVVWAKRLRNLASRLKPPQRFARRLSCAR